MWALQGVVDCSFFIKLHLQWMDAPLHDVASEVNNVPTSVYELYLLYTDYHILIERPGTSLGC